MRLILILLVFIVCAIVCHRIAKLRGANPVFWGVVGLLFGPLALPFVFYLDKKDD